MAVVHRPRLLLLDEPTAGVDTETRARILAFVTTFAAQGAAVCYTSHYLPEVEQVADSLLVFTRGRLVAAGTVPDIIARYARGRVELVLDGPPPDSGPFAGGEVTGDTVVLHTDRPFDLAARLLEDGSLRARLQSIQAIPASLEDAYLRLGAS
jgi:ABC-2 type transport system ATP-binding protein